MVAYHPKEAELRALCAGLRANASRVVVVDNTDVAPPVPLGVLGDVDVVTLGENTGIAHALNVGIRHAMERHADVIVLFDQDSAVPDGFMERLVASLAPGEPGVAAPLAVDKRSGKAYPSERITSSGWSQYVYPEGRTSPYPVDLVITSGCAATAATFEAIGLMDEGLFIDYVDYDWCFRCRRAGIPVRVVPGAVLHHAMGDVVVRRGPYRGIVHGPARTYYKVRNSLLLFRRPHVPVLFALRQVVSALVHNLIQLGFVKPKGQYLQTYYAAVRDGLAGVTGKRPARSMIQAPHATQRSTPQ